MTRAPMSGDQIKWNKASSLNPHFWSSNIISTDSTLEESSIGPNPDLEFSQSDQSMCLFFIFPLALVIMFPDVLLWTCELEDA